MNVVRTLACICCVWAGLALAHAVAPPGAEAAERLSARLRLPGDKTMEAKTSEIDPIAVLGRAWGERELHDFVASLGIEGTPVVKRGDSTAFLQNPKLGIVLTFRIAEALDVPLRDDAPDAVVLSNVRMNGPGYSKRAPFTGDLPFGLRFGDTKDQLYAKLGAPDRHTPRDARSGFIPPIRWDTARYALYAQLDEAGTLIEVALQVPYVRSTKPGFEER